MNLLTYIPVGNSASPVLQKQINAKEKNYEKKIDYDSNSE